MILDSDLRVRLGALDLEVALRAEAGEVVALLGPNGAGKSTVLRALAGLLPLDQGYVEIDGRRFDDPGARRSVPPEGRPVGMVFQDYLLFPHLSLLENVAFGPRAQGMDKAAARERAHGGLERVGLGELVQAKPRSISGGQAQRVALARALATEPRLLLLDEPFAALDAGTRLSVRRDLRTYLARFPGVTILVTHDMVDALALAQRVVVLEAGAVIQSGTFEQIATRPRSRYVADLVGVNLLRGTGRGTTVDLGHRAEVVVAEPSRGPVLVMIQPSSVTLHRLAPESSARNVWPCVVTGIDALGSRVRIQLEVTGGMPLTAEVTPAAVAALGLEERASVWASVKATEVVVYPA